MKLQREIREMNEFRIDFEEFMRDFDMEMDYQANYASYENSYSLAYQEILKEDINRRSDNDIFARSEFKLPTFSQIGLRDLSIIDEIGRITDNSDFSVPLVVFNTHQLEAFSY